MVGAAGCATTGLAWVQEPESGVDLSPPSGDGAKPAAELAAARASGPQAVPGAVRRIDRTITLGETTVVPTASSEGRAPQGTSSSPVVVNIYVASAPAPIYGPAYGVVSGVSSFGGAGSVGARSIGASTVGASTSSSMRPGMDWTPAPSYGPAFPYRMGPSSPWVGDGTDRTRSSR